MSTTQELARQAALRYIDCINHKQLEPLLQLFAADGQLNHPFGLFQGRDKLAEFYGGLVMQADTTLVLHRIAAENDICVVEVSATSPQAPDKIQYALDLFQVDAQGKITDLSIYYRNVNLG
ncbi:MAG TPA: nuclear transport factor 2 family protein [Pseudomonadales bacterium]